MGPYTNTGKATQSQFKTQSFFFDCSDPSVAFTDGVYATDIILKNNALVFFTAIKYMQDVSAYPAITIDVFSTSTTINSEFNSDTLPIAGTPPGVYRPGNLVPGHYAVIAGPTFSTQINNNNCGVIVELTGITGSGVTALSFMFDIMYIEFDF